MENQNIDEITKFIKELNEAFSSHESLVELIEVVNGKTMSPEQKQILSKMTGLSPTTKDEQTSWLFNFNFIDEVGDVFLVVTDKNSKDWVGIKWTPDGIMVYNKTNGYMAKYTDSYHQHNLKAYPSIKADVTISFNGNRAPFNAETSLSLVEVGGGYGLLASMKIGGVMAETPLLRIHLGAINQSPVLLKLLTRLEAQKRQTGCVQSSPSDSDMLSRMRNFCSDKKIAFITPRQTMNEPKDLGHQSTPKDQEIDLGLYTNPNAPKKENTEMEPTNQQAKVETVPMVEVKMTGDVTANGDVIVTVTSNMNNKVNIIKWATNYALLTDPSNHCSNLVPIHPVVVNKPTGIDSPNEKLKCVCVDITLPIYNNRIMTNVKVFLAMTGEKFFRELEGFASIGDEIIVMSKIPLTPRMMAGAPILQTLLSSVTDHPELELPDNETKTPCFTPPTPNPIPQPIFNPYGSHPSQQFTQQPPFNSFNPQQPYGSQPSFGPTPYPPHQPPFTPGSYPQQPKPSFNPQQQQPVMGNCAGMGQGLCRNPVPQQSSPTAGQMADHLTYWGNFANQNYSMGNMVNMGSNSVLDQMNGLNQRVKAQQQPTATKEEIKDQAMFWSNIFK